MNVRKLFTQYRINRSNLLPIVLTVAMLLAFVISVAHLVGALNVEFDTGQAALDNQLTEQGQSFTQLQRESLRLLNHVNLPLDRLDREQARLQIDLVASRFFQLQAVADQPTTRGDQAEASRGLVARQDEVVGAAERWFAAPSNEAIRQTLVDTLTDLERDVNQDVINFGRRRIQSVIVFRDSTTQVQAAFAGAGVTFVLLMLALLYNIYRYLRQVNETEAAFETIRFKDQFLAVMSHELRTPLNAIIGFLGIMKMQGPNSTKLPHMIDRSRANAERLLSLIDDILDMSKIEAGKFEIHAEPSLLRELINRWRSQGEILAQQKSLTFEVNVDPAMPERMLMDADAVSKVTTNLISNAIKFTEKGSVKVDIDRLGNQWRVRVTDTGIGIAQDKLGVIFESFRQVDGSIRRSFGGSGLGLSIVKQLSELMGGRVEVESQEGAGSVFTITLPLVALRSMETQEAAAIKLAQEV